jgi:hypothetical protein
MVAQTASAGALMRPVRVTTSTDGMTRKLVHVDSSKYLEDYLLRRRAEMT